MHFTSNDRSQNRSTFVYQTTLDTIKLKIDTCTDSVSSWKSNGVFNSKLKPQYSAFLNSIKLSEYGIGIKFDKNPLAVEQNNYLTKIVNFSIVYDLEIQEILLTISNLRIAYLEQVI